MSIIEFKVKYMVIILFVIAAISLIGSILSFMGKLNEKKRYTAEGVIKEDGTPDKKQNIISGFLFLSLSLTSFVNGLRYLTNIAIFGYIGIPLLLISLVMIIISFKNER